MEINLLTNLKERESNVHSNGSNLNTNNIRAVGDATHSTTPPIATGQTLIVTKSVDRTTKTVSAVSTRLEKVNRSEEISQFKRVSHPLNLPCQALNISYLNSP